MQTAAIVYLLVISVVYILSIYTVTQNHEALWDKLKSLEQAQRDYSDNQQRIEALTADLQQANALIDLIEYQNCPRKKKDRNKAAK